jgi:AraC family transcriptional activator of pobA
VPVGDRPIASDLYAVSLKRGDECHVEFGRQTYDGQAGTLVFLAPGQTLRALGDGEGLAHEGEGWTLVFHPDLLAGSPLSALMEGYRFFDYGANEALHLTEPEREIATGVVRQLEREASVAPDPFAQGVLAAQLQLLFSHCQRSYARQFRVRTGAGPSVVARLDRHLEEHFASKAAKRGLPTVRACARALGYSPDYLSDLLREETGAGARDHIHRAVIGAAKARLLSSKLTASEVAYALGFEHPQHFSRLFREKTGSSPGEWRRGAKPAG